MYFELTVDAETAKSDILLTDLIKILLDSGSVNISKYATV
jgi:hypothetical protein